MNYHQDLHILIAEDDYLAREMVVELLKEMGHTRIQKASDGHQALDIVAKLHTGADPVDVVLMDIDMPHINGLDASGEIQATCPTPVIILTAYESPELLDRASAQGVGAYLVKPPNRSDLERAMSIAMARFHDLLELRRLNDELQSALDRVKKLSGLLPICSYCKRIRDDQGYWRDVAEYIQQHSDAHMSHGICAECAAQHFPNFKATRDSPHKQR